MAWLSLTEFSSEKFYAVLDELESASPRAAVIVGASFVEDHLTRLIKSRLMDDENALTHFFDQNGALGTFSAKTKLGYLMGLYSQEAWKELETVRSIRNDFAHELRISFDMQSV